MLELNLRMPSPQPPQTPAVLGYSSKLLSPLVEDCISSLKCCSYHIEMFKFFTIPCSLFLSSVKVLGA